MRLNLTMVMLSLVVITQGGWAEDRASKPLKVFILTGQSNMQGHAHVRTLEHLGMDPQTVGLLHEIRDEQGKPRVCEDVWISSLSAGGTKQGRLTTGFGADDDKIGPELTFGIFMQKELNEPILIIKTAWGGKSLNTDFRPPSAGPYPFNARQLEQFANQGKDPDTIKAEKTKATGAFYRSMIDHVQKVVADISQIYPEYNAQQGYELAGLVWFQGWNDMVDGSTYPDRGKQGGYDEYSDLLTHFIRDVRRDLSAPQLPVVIGVMGVGGPVNEYTPEQRRYQAIHESFRLAMAAPAKLPEFQNNVVAVLTEQYWDRELVALRARQADLQQRVKQLAAQQSLTGEQRRAAEAKYRNEEFSEDELAILEKGVSNQEFHYLGSAKIITRIGRGFAQAMSRLIEVR